MLHDLCKLKNIVKHVFYYVSAKSSCFCQKKNSLYIYCMLLTKHIKTFVKGGGDASFTFDFPYFFCTTTYFSALGFCSPENRFKIQSWFLSKNFKQKQWILNFSDLTSLAGLTGAGLTVQGQAGLNPAATAAAAAAAAAAASQSSTTAGGKARSSMSLPLISGR